MTLTRPATGASGATGPAPRPGTGRAVAAVVLVTLGALIPLLGPSAALHGTGEAAAPGVGGIALLRAVLFTALSVPVGELFVRRLARSVPGAPPAVPRAWAPYAAGAGLVAALGLASVVATGNLVPDSLAQVDVGGLYASRDGKLALVEVNAFLVAGLCAVSARPATQVWPLAAVVVAEALRAHPPTEHSPLIGSGLTLVHLTCAALWVGGLLYALRTLRQWRRAADPGGAASGVGDSSGARDGGGPAAGAALLGRYARVALGLLAAITATGVWSSLRRMPPGTVLDQLTTTAYGRALLAKVLLVAAVAALALWARRRLSRAPDPLTAYAPARAEVIALGLAVAVSGLLTALPVPIRW
ncbi:MULTISPECIES: CopD family protein [unclassified Streptomyces]|uniref:CopD family protein n=1 Tax=unclassified Streptomyces TaxID=2593676 RepID=UPI0036E8D8AB